MPVSFSKNTEELEVLLGYTFRSRRLLVEALTHKSYHHETQDKSHHYNERLEFLGDSVLGLVIAEFFFLRDSSLTEADMSKMKSYLVRESVLFEIASKLTLGKYIRLGRGEESTGGRQKRSVLADAIEALFGALFLDSDYATTRKVILTLFEEKILNVVAKKEGHDFKSELQERCQELYGILPEYRIVKQEGAEHKKLFTAEVYINDEFYGSGVGKSKKEAQMVAAKEALLKLVQGTEKDS